ncbi:MAG: NYN domain-containing protein [Anaerolineae bacterium]|nr:NYN domain-containing protein [Anaerolineae bacterium]
MKNDIAVFLDLDNLVIGAKQANLPFDINFILEKVRNSTNNGRIVMRKSYGDWRQNQKLLEQLTIAGFTTQSTVRINNFSKNLADMQIVVDTMDTLIDGHQYNTYVLITGDRDFTPLVQSLRKRGKHVIGVGVKHTASRSFVSLCDEYIFYEELIPAPALTEDGLRHLLQRALSNLLVDGVTRIRASVLKEQMGILSRDAFDQSQQGNGSFRKFLEKYPDLIQLDRDGTTIYVSYRSKEEDKSETPLHAKYRSGLKRQRFRVVPANIRLVVLKDMIRALSEHPDMYWRQLIDMLSADYNKHEKNISKNMINDMLLIARQAQVISTLKGKSLATAPVQLQLEGANMFQESVVRCDAAYLREILELGEPFDIEEVALALYDSPKYVPYLKMVMSKWMDN